MIFAENKPFNEVGVPVEETKESVNPVVKVLFVEKSGAGVGAGDGLGLGLGDGLGLGLGDG